jgi:hypothetical protein
VIVVVAFMSVGMIVLVTLVRMAFVFGGVHAGFGHGMRVVFEGVSRTQ